MPIMKMACVSSLSITLSLASFFNYASQSVLRAPHEIIAAAPTDAWRAVDNEQVLKFELATGSVYIELNSQLAPEHVKNIKNLVREKFYDGLSIYRFVEGFVAQGGDQGETKKLSKAKRAVDAEFFYTSKNRLPITSLKMIDGYAPVTGFLGGFAVAQSADGKNTWQTHCTGIFAMARGNEINSGGTEFYITLAPVRYLDRNITVFGRVLHGMEHVNRLMRTPRPDEDFNVITHARILGDISAIDKTEFTVFDTEHTEFQALIQARKSRPEAWFVERPNYADVCSITIPTRIITGG
ncbi:cyclophilin [Pseudoalteromonas sp. MSK9-3]|uniref:peptidylprolyl isomerase n=1 Tax=Pseudoalteromonas sp. MSK9-3 TaxID=1897633 RepID=UPI000E6D45A5|nr:peptidylprolyl isomerase [Pseudoalteromonas sp. MSK9-3]RJE73784.1 cyclophilin [Pseudoalteromonas sp. MSK9-3]